ncbi:MAG: TonB-dependent receptor plug domain-containing protein [Bacteroidales bacterium]|jgi:outer membrane receptor for ferrienterochelin and colicin|nr:TonB-dependent receptor plug domain-containing protein [Bacteroidales bacterium]
MEVLRHFLFLSFLLTPCGLFAQTKAVKDMSKEEVLHMTVEQLYVLPLEDVAALSLIVGMSMEELYETVSTSSRSEEAMEEAPNVMHVVTHETIKRRGYKNLREVLINIPGFGVFMKDVQYVAQVRGIAPNDNEKIMFMVDGHGINQMSEPDMLNNSINLSNMERIEIIIGPGSVLYGAESLAATVNMIPRKPYKNEVSVTAGVPDEWSVNALLGKVWDTDKSVSVTFTGIRREGWNAYKTGAVEEGSVYEALSKAGSTMPQRMYPSFFLTAGGQYENWSIGMTSLSYASSRIGWAGSISLEEREKLRNQDFVNALVVKHKSKPTNRMELLFTASINNKRVKQPNNLEMKQNSFKTEAGVHHTGTRNFLQAGIQFGYYQERDNVVLDYADSVHAYYPWSGTNPDRFEKVIVEHPLIPNSDLYSIGGYVSDKFGISDRIKLLAAIRADYHSILERNRVSISPRVALIYSPKKYFTTKLMFNTATRYPSARASHLNVWDQNNPQRNGRMVTQPEQLMTVELENIFFGDIMRISLVAYYQYLKNFISWFEPFMNVGNFKGWGFEATWKTTFSPNISVWANATVNKTGFTQKATTPLVQDGSVVPTSVTVNEKGEMIAVPKVSGSMGGDFKIFDKLSFSPSMNYFTGQPTSDYAHYNATTHKFRYFYVNHQMYLDASLLYEGIFRGLDARLAARNILNNRRQVGTVFANQTYTPQGTTVQVTLFYSF